MQINQAHKRELMLMCVHVLMLAHTKAGCIKVKDEAGLALIPGQHGYRLSLLQPSPGPSILDISTGRGWERGRIPNTQRMVLRAEMLHTQKMLNLPLANNAVWICTALRT